MIAFYVPHAGYPEAVYNATFEQFEETISDARRQHRVVIAGGDFNSQLVNDPHMGGKPYGG